MRYYSAWQSDAENEGLWEATEEGCWYCLGDRVEPGESAWDGTVNSHKEAKSFWEFADNSHCYVTSEWRDPVVI